MKVKMKVTVIVISISINKIPDYAKDDKNEFFYETY